MNNIRDKFQTILKSMRLPFLILTPACLFLGWSVVIADQNEVAIHLFILSFLGAVLAHISVNMLNEYLDFKSGLDLKTKKTRFSGGSGALPENPEMAKVVLVAGVISLILTLIIGLFFIWKQGWGIIPIGIAGLLLIIAYTGWINKHPFLCLVAPGIGFGFLMVVGANFVLTGEYSVSLWIIGFIPFFLINNLLLLNQYPDIDADRDVGRNHLPIAYGTKISNIVYFLFTLTTIVVIISSVLTEILPTVGLIALLPMPLAFFSLSGAIRYGSSLGHHPQYLGANVAVTILTPILLGASIIFG
jgi:1,4-dihydroxy-2-naphthoate polyprenyltransferase